MNPAEDGPKRAARGRLVKVLVHTRHDRAMRLEPFASRCVRGGEVHELVTTDQRGVPDGGRVDRVGFLGFVEIDRSAVIDCGDVVWVGDRRIGTVLGFDVCHFPNHLNVLIASGELLTGRQLGLEPEDEVCFVQAASTPTRPSRNGVRAPKEMAP